MELTLSELRGKGLKCYIERSLFGQTKIEYLGFWVAHNDVKPVETNTSNKHMKPPTYQKEVWKFIGVVNYYHNIWARSSDTLATLTKIAPSNVNFKWTNIEQDAFDEIKRIEARDRLLDYPDFNWGI